MRNAALLFLTLAYPTYFTENSNQRCLLELYYRASVQFSYQVFKETYHLCKVQFSKKVINFYFWKCAALKACLP